MIPTILFLHGDGSPVIRRNWLLPLNRELRDRGQETVADTDVVDPDYSGVFQRPPAGNGQVPRRWTPPDDATYARARDAYELRRARLETRLRSMFGESESKFTAVPMPNTIPSFGVLWKHAAAYQDSDSARRAVWRLVLDALPRSGPLIIIGYSLGSVVAVDLLKRLAQGPGPQHAVECLITMGSPLGAISRLRANCGLRDSFPYDTVRSWVNVYDPRDLPTGGRGLRDHFDAVLDAPIRLPDRFLPGLADHGADAYASQPVVTDVILQTLIGQALDVTSSAPVAKRVKGSELVLLKMAYASSLQTAIPADEQKRRRRLSLARESLAEQASRATAELSRRETTEVPVVLTPVDFLRDPALHLRGLWSDEQLVPLAVSLATGWPVPPYASETQWESKERSVALLRTLNRIRTGEGSVTTKSRGSSANISDDEYATVILEGVRTGREVMGRKGSALPAALIVAGVVALAATGVGLVVSRSCRACRRRRHHQHSRGLRPGRHGGWDGVARGSHRCGLGTGGGGDDRCGHRCPNQDRRTSPDLRK